MNLTRVHHVQALLDIPDQVWSRSHCFRKYSGPEPNLSCPKKRPDRSWRPGRKPKPCCWNLTPPREDSVGIVVQVRTCRYGVKTPNEATSYTAERGLPDWAAHGGERRPGHAHPARGEPGHDLRPDRCRPARHLRDRRASDGPHAVREPVDAAAPLRAAGASDHAGGVGQPVRPGELPARFRAGRGDRAPVAGVQAPARADRARAPALRPDGHPGPGARAPAPRQRPPRRGEPGPHRNPASTRSPRPRRAASRWPTRWPS